MAQQESLKSIAEEAADCRAAFAGIEVGAIVQHCHHEQWLEVLDEPAENRISYILAAKAEKERAARLRRFRPLSKADAKRLPRKLAKARAELDKARAELDKAIAELAKAIAELAKAIAELAKARAGKKMHADVCGCPWSEVLDIFGEAR